MPRGRTEPQALTCIEPGCGTEFVGHQGKRVRCPACSKVRYLAYQRKYYAEHPEKFNQPDKARIRYHATLAKRRLRPDETGKFGEVPGTEWIFDIRAAEMPNLLVLQRVPAERVEQWIESVVLQPRRRI